MKLPELPELYMDTPEVRKLSTEIEQLSSESQRSFSGNDNWRDKQSIIRRLEHLKKRRELILADAKVQYDIDMEKYEKDIVVYEEALAERKKKMNNPIQSLDLENE